MSTIDSLWRKLDGSAVPAGDVGAKAAALDRLIALDAPVPAAAALSVEAYRQVAASNSLAAFVDGLPHTVDAGDLQADEDRVDDVFLHVALPEEVVAACDAAYEYASAGEVVAVRSSATAEDLAGASFAGQYRSFIGVGIGDLERAVRLCWASLWAPAARAYRHAHGIPSQDAAMGVIVQRLVVAERSGVAFTVDPTGAEPDRIRVEMVRGMGERLVSGRVTPEVFHVRRDDWSPLERGAPWFLPDLARWALRAEEAFGCPQDLEWSVADGRLYLLQARPITFPASGDGFDTPPVPDATFTTAGVDEMLPGVLPPLVWTMNRPLLEDALRTLHRALGTRPPAPNHPMVGRFAGRAALNLSALTAAAGQVPGGSAAEVERQYLGRVVSGDGTDVPNSILDRFRRMGTGVRALRLRRRLPTDAATFLEAVRLTQALQPAHDSLPSAALGSYRRSLRAVAAFGYRTEVAVGAAAAASYGALERTLERWLPADEAGRFVQRLTAGGVGEHAAGGEAMLAVRGIECGHCADLAVAAAVDGGPVEEIEGGLQRRDTAGHDTLGAIEEALARSGSMAVYGGRTWNEDRAAFWAALRNAREVAADGPNEPGGPDGPLGHTGDRGDSRDTGARALHELLDTLTRTTRWRRTRILTGQVVDIRARLLRSLVDDTTTFLRLREAVKSALLRLGGEERRVVCELVRRLAGDGQLAAGDEWYLTDEELDRAASGGSLPPSDELAYRRHALDRARRRSLPEVFSGLLPLQPDEPPDAQVGEGTDDGVLHGWAASPGRTEGIALVVDDLSDVGEVDGQTVLVGHATDPSWTPILIAAGAIVMEQGGPLSHAAIVAREFGVPAVLRVPAATSRLHTGDRVVVDGVAGTVEILGTKEAA